MLPFLYALFIFSSFVIVFDFLCQFFKLANFLGSSCVFFTSVKKLTFMKLQNKQIIKVLFPCKIENHVKKLIDCEGIKIICILCIFFLIDLRN